MENQVVTKKGNKLLLGIILGVVIGGLIFGGGTYYFVSGISVKDKENANVENNNDKQNNNKTQNNGNDDIKITNNNYNANDYVEVKNYDVSRFVNVENWKVKEITFKNLPLGTTIEFLRKHKDYIIPAANNNYVAPTNTVIYGTYNNVLSVYTKEEVKGGLVDIINNYSLNVNLDNNKIITNEELLKMYNLNINSVYEKILNNLATTVKVDEFSLDVDGSLTAKTISLTDFKRNISDYSKTLNNRFNIFTLYVKDNKVNCVYSQGTILELLGMSVYMGLIEDQTITLN